MDDRDNLLCTHCGHVGIPDRHTPGSGWIELVLWLCVLVPGLIYSIWRRSASRPVCERCGSAVLLPLESPVARTFAANHQIALPVPAPPSAGAYQVGGGLGRLVGRAIRKMRGA